jgi:hypothetical protein
MLHRKFRLDFIPSNSVYFPTMPNHLNILNDVTICTPLEAVKSNMHHKMIHLYFTIFFTP